ncbi:hypothetical protein F7725_023489 [Dissostichus mawsoni]|uniref:COMMD9 N-terminal domain-containing protein n=1 Tax=Dissostichus mawsoni TaxID=36200 RepID=A0A7J5Z0U6_DISMA|nr:hypothetical protein F7725_023489 [Dissostichus mawsoni]
MSSSATSPSRSLQRRSERRLCSESPRGGRRLTETTAETLSISTVQAEQLVHSLHVLSHHVLFLGLSLSGADPLSVPRLLPQQPEEPDHQGPAGEQMEDLCQAVSTTTGAESGVSGHDAGRTRTNQRPAVRGGREIKDCRWLIGGAFVSWPLTLRCVCFVAPLTCVSRSSCSTASCWRGSLVSRQRKPPPPAPARLCPSTRGSRASIIFLTDEGSQPGDILFFCCQERDRHPQPRERAWGGGLLNVLHHRGLTTVPAAHHVLQRNIFIIITIIIIFITITIIIILIIFITIIILIISIILITIIIIFITIIIILIIIIIIITTTTTTTIIIILITIIINN